MTTKDEIKPRFVPFKCPICNGYGSTSYGKIPCKSCAMRGFVVIDQETGMQVTNEDDEYEQRNTTA